MLGMPFLPAIDAQQFRGFYEAIIASLDSFGPEFQVALAALVILLLDLFLSAKASRHLAWVALLGCIIPALSIEVHGAESHSLFLGMTAIDPFANFFKLFFLLGSIPVILLSYIAFSLHGRHMGEYYAVLLASVFGAMLMASSTHFLMLFMSLELLSICSYILVGYIRRDRRGAEASLKYIIYGSVAAAIMAYGLSLYYGMTGSAELASLGELVWIREHEIWTKAALDARAAITVTVALLFIFMGIAYKMSTIPMHFWAPDVYEGAPTPVTAFLSVLSKVAGFTLAVRFLHGLATAGGLPWGETDQVVAFSSVVPWRELMIIISILTMTLGNLAALWQTNLKRLLAYSSIAHAGYMMMGLTFLVPPEGTSPAIGGVEAISFYMLAYLAMNFGAFAVVILIENRLGSVDLKDYQGLGGRAPFLSVALTVFLFSLIGVPPTAGFTGKLQLFLGVLSMETAAHYFLAIAAAANTAVSAYYYLKIAREMYLAEAPAGGRIKSPAIGGLLVTAMVVMTFYLFFGAETVLRWTRQLHIHL